MSPRAFPAYRFLSWKEGISRCSCFLNLKPDERNRCYGYPSTRPRSVRLLAWAFADGKSGSMPVSLHCKRARFAPFGLSKR